MHSPAKANNPDSILSVMSNSGISFEEKYALLADIQTLQPMEQIKILSEFLKESEVRKNNRIICEIYCKIGHSNLFLGKMERSKMYLDSASLYMKKIKDNNTLGLYNYIWGDYYNMTLDEVRSHQFYYKAIGHYEKSSQNNKRIIDIFSNIAFSYIQKGDTENLKIIIDRLTPLVSKSKNISSDVIYMRIKSYYYGLLYNKSKELKPVRAYLDSAIIYGERIINFYETDNSHKLYPEDIAYSYIALAGNYLMLDKRDYNRINTLTDKALSLSSAVDTTMIVNCLWIKGQSLRGEGKTEDAEILFEKQLAIMQKWSISENLVMYADLYKTLSEVNLLKGDYKQAFLYNREESEYRKQILDNDKYKIISDLQTKYETDKKEQRIRLQSYIILFLACLCISIFIGAFFVFRWQRLNKNIAKKQQKIIKLEKSEAKLQIQNESDKEEIQKEQDEFVIQLNNKIKEFLKYCPDDQRRYLEKLEAVDRDSIFILKGKGLKKSRIQYCICFAIGMKKEHITACYNIADQTIRKNRSKIKGDLELEKDDDLDIYLIDLFMLKYS